jgi:hypothetical protein
MKLLKIDLFFRGARSGKKSEEAFTASYLLDRRISPVMNVLLFAEHVRIPGFRPRDHSDDGGRQGVASTELDDLHLNFLPYSSCWGLLL